MGISLALLAEGLAQGLGGAGHVLQQQQQQAEMRQMQQQEQEQQRQMDGERRMLALEQQRERQQGQEQQRMLAMGERERQAGMAGLFSRGLITAPELAAIPEGAQPADIERLMATLSPERRAETFGQRRTEALGQTKKPEGPSANLMARARVQAVEDYRAEYRAMHPDDKSGLIPPPPEEEIARRARQRVGIPEPVPEPVPVNLFDHLKDEIQSGGDVREIVRVMDEAKAEGKITPDQHFDLSALLARSGKDRRREIEGARIESEDAERRAWLQRALEARRKKP